MMLKTTVSFPNEKGVQLEIEYDFDGIRDFKNPKHLYIESAKCGDGVNWFDWLNDIAIDKLTKIVREKLANDICLDLAA
jgi:hypothetical protein